VFESAALIRAHLRSPALATDGDVPDRDAPDRDAPDHDAPDRDAPGSAARDRARPSPSALGRSRPRTPPDPCARSGARVRWRAVSSPAEGTDGEAPVPGHDPLGGTTLAALIGPTASGKSAVALLVAEACEAEIVSLDSMQVYRGMDVGTAKPDAAERARVAHHMLDLADPSERYDVTRFLGDLSIALADIRARGKRALFVGGTGLYLKILSAGLFRGPEVDPALRAELEARARAEGALALHAELARADPASAAKLHPNDVKRVVRALEVWQQTGRPLSAWQTQWGSASGASRALVGLQIAVPELDRRIARRAEIMLASGWPEEAARIRDSSGFGPTAIQALGYAEALDVHARTLTHAEAARRIALATRQFARRQRTWYRKFPDVTWIPAETRAPAVLAGEVRRALVW